jgi:quinol monooxygenase YgiN
VIHVIATIRTAAGRREEFLEAFGALVPLVRAEAGCLEYGPAIDWDADIAGASSVRPDVVTVVEKWETPAALQAHLAAPHVVRYRERVKDLVTGLEIRVLRPV